MLKEGCPVSSLGASDDFAPINQQVMPGGKVETGLVTEGWFCTGRKPSYLKIDTQSFQSLAQRLANSKVGSNRRGKEGVRLCPGSEGIG